MKLFSKKSFLVIFLFLTAINSHAKTVEIAPSKATDWREDYAYSLGIQAYIFGFPWIFLPEIRWKWVTQSAHSQWSPYAALNQFWHARTLATATYRDGGSPNVDTLYSIAWLDLKEPIILSVPAIENRYYTMQMASIDSDNFAYVGTRTTGTKAGNYAIVGPDWKGSLPQDVKALPPSRTPYAMIFGRTLVFGEKDLSNVYKIQDQYKLTPLSSWGKEASQLPQSHDVWKPYNAQKDALAEWKTMNRAMTENPPTENQQLLLKLFSKINLGPNQDVEQLDEASKRGLARASKDGMKLLRQVIVTGLGKQVNGWRYPPMSIGKAGVEDDFLTRAALQCLEGIVANYPIEATYILTAHDKQGQPLSGNHDYVMHFTADGLPKVGAFWSVTMYGLDNNLVANSLNRYKVGTYPKGELKFEEDGGLTIYIQNQSPGSEKASNWLPAPKESFYLILRAYMPSQEIVEQMWVPPAVASEVIP